MKQNIIVWVLLSSVCICIPESGAFAQKELPKTPISGQSVTEKRVTSETQSRRRADALIMEAYTMRKSGNNQRAIFQFRQSIREFGVYAYMRVSEPLAELFVEEKMYQDAVDLYRIYVYERPDKKWGNSNSQSVDVLSRFVFVLSVTGNKGEAWDVFQRIVPQVPEDIQPVLMPYIRSLNNRASYNDITLKAVALTILGRTYSGRMIYDQNGRHLADKTPDAIIAYKLALKYIPRFVPAQDLLASSPKNIGDVKQANP